MKEIEKENYKKFENSSFCLFIILLVILNKILLINEKNKLIINLNINKFIYFFILSISKLFLL